MDKNNFVTCYLCGNNKYQLAFIKLGYKIFFCPKCHLCWLDFNEDYQNFLHSYYEKGYFQGDIKYRAYANYEEDKKTIQRNMNNYLNKIKKFKSSGKILDVGCATGYFLEVAQEEKFHPYGIDVSHYAIDIAKKKFHENVQCSSIASSKLNNQNFDIITMFDILEHLKEPIEDLKILHKSLKDDGLLVIQTGDTKSTWAKTMKHNWHFYAPPQHLYFYSAKNINTLLSKAGFQVIKIEKTGKWVSLRYLFHMMSYVRRGGVGDRLYKLVCNNILGEIPIYLRFNDNMICYAKKAKLL